MAKQLQLRRGTTAQHSTFTGAVGEVTIDTDKDVVVVHDGATAGGFPSQKELVSGTNIKTVNSTSLLGSGNVAVQPILVSGTNIKTINSTSLLGSGNIDTYTQSDTKANFAYKVSSIEGLASLDGTTPTVIVADLDRGGTFIWSSTGTANGGTVFAGSSGYWIRQYDGAVNVKWFGAVGDGVTDDTAAIQAAFNYAASIGACVVDETGKNYKITSMVTILCSCDLSNATFLVPAASVPIAVRVGSTTADVFTLSLKMPKLLNISKTTLGWTGFQTAVGFDFANLYSSNIYIPDVRKFGVGVDVGGYGKGGLDAGNAYNTYEIGLLYDNFINLRLRSKGTGGFANQNTFIGGSYSGTGAEGPATGISGSYGIELNGVNNNTFLNPSIEAIWNEYQIQLKNCSFNTFISQRLENTVPGRINFHADTAGQNQSNLFMNGYAFDAYNVSKTGAGTSLYNKFIGNKYSDAIQYGGVGLVVNNLVSDSASNPHITGYTAAIDPATRRAFGATDWSYKIYSEGYTGKRSTDAEANFRVKLDSLSGRIYVGDGTGAPNWYLSGDSSSSIATINNAAAIIPIPDNTTSLGLGSYRWSVIYAATGTINTSDDREKTYLDITEAERLIAIELKESMKKFKFNDAIELKGEDSARIHFGASAQTVKSIFEKHGLVAEDYAIFCYNEWKEQVEIKDEEGNILQEYRPAGNRYGLRYDELLCFIISSI